ncbi:MAG: PRC-barrel domain containing protein [Methanosphaera stadtmanae]|nr:PRC-barrel domain containing protein [Methanosphaera stadtmanae]
MKVTQIIGKKVLDGKVNEIGKIQDIDIDLKEEKINSITINTNEISLRKVTFDITTDVISEIGDYVLLNVPKSEIIPDTKKSEEVSDVEIVNPKELED